MSLEHLRIAILSAHSCPVGDLGVRDTGGMSVYIRELSRELGRQGHTVDIFTRVHDARDPRIEELAAGVRLIHLRAGKEARIDKMDVYASLPEFIDNLEDFRRTENSAYDIIFSHYWISALVGKYLQETWQVPYITMYHTLGAIKNDLAIGEKEPALRITAERETAYAARRIIVATEKEKEALSRLYGTPGSKIRVVPCGVNMELFRPVDRTQARRTLGLGEERLVLYVGRIDPLKGIGNLLRAVALLKGSSKLRLVIVGGDEESGELAGLKGLACELGVSEMVTFWGREKHEGLPLFYSAADICVVPSYYESFGLVALEALACGTPVLATDVGRLRDIIRQGETGYIVESNHPQVLAHAIAGLLRQPWHGEERKLAIRASVSSFGWSEIAGKIAREMREVIEEALALPV
ncbi:MAG: glycosyltransferase [Dehalococcoidales bacterium]|nr:glycosyltransferase [Dehalococcoidales bacterium]